MKFSNRLVVAFTISDIPNVLVLYSGLKFNTGKYVKMNNIIIDFYYIFHSFSRKRK